VSYEALVSALESYFPTADFALVRKAYEYSAFKHKNQVRVTGEPYFSHLEETAMLVCQMKLDVSSVVSALLHDVLEDTETTYAELEREFGKDVAGIVEGVTNLGRIGGGKEVRQAESFRKMLVAMSKDIRVILVKLCDRLHNMRTLEHMQPDKQVQKAEETRDIYAPLANRLGIHWLKSELEDLSMRYLRPTLYEELKASFEQTREQRSAYVQDTSTTLSQLFVDAGMSVSIKGRAKHFFSIWQKMERNNIGLDEIHDLMGFRVLVASLRECYEALGVVHAAWKPIPGRFKDYIAMPKPNMYQSLHTTVIGPGGHRVEIQIRTTEMNKIAEEGIAAHWAYKEGNDSGFDLQWVTELVETQQYINNPDEFLQSVKGELFPEEVFVFTPRGDLVRLSQASTPVDFAYAIHSDVGHRATGAKVNGSIVPLHHQLKNGDTVEIITRRNHVPSKDWLTFVRTSKARQRVRAFLKQQERERSIALGIELLSKDLRRLQSSLKTLEKQGKVQQVSSEFGLSGTLDLYAEVGYGKLSLPKVLSKLLPDGGNIEEKLKQDPSPIRKIFERAASVSKQKGGVQVSGLDDVMVRFARCCSPLPGDRIVGFVTRGRGVAVHRADCSEVLDADGQRLVEVSWNSSDSEPRRVRLVVHTQDQIGLLANVTRSITDSGGDIKSAQIKTTEFKKAEISFELELTNAAQLNRIVRAIESVPGVIRVDRARTE
jgi:GTP diphosphokinase / guanosine-3',5'-bis(diphosphate) 3'-diphosphatase